MGDEAHPPRAPSTTRRLFTIRVLEPSELPAHASLPAFPKDADADDADDVRDRQPTQAEFASTCLAEALAFLEHTWPVLADKGSKASPPAAAPVHVFAQAFNNPHGGREHWFARRSVHDGAERAGSASWREFERGLWRAHSVNEAVYTPNIFDAREVVDWGRVEMGEGERWRDVSIKAYEMAHSMPFPVNNRVFPTLVISATYKPASPARSAFLLVQIPLNLRTSPNSLYSNESNKDKGQTAEQKKSVVLGRYVSVERCLEKADGSVAWEMATASDAQGSVPMSLQKLGVPGAVVKDVGLFIGWVATQRGAWWAS